jgi:prevent-host-death family protein
LSALVATPALLFGTYSMQTVNIHEARTHLSKLVEKAAKGEPFILAKAGKALARVVALDTPVAGQVRRLDFRAGRIRVPDDFDTMGRVEIDRLV